jgi:chromosomal replication initiation ATPase DnaA
MSQQLTFDLPARAALGRDDFFVSPANATALATVEGYRSWPQGKMVLVGDAGAGKTHLAHVFAALTQGRVVDVSALDTDTPPELAQGPLALDSADAVRNEAAFFHLHNLMAQAGHPFLITARQPPARWNLSLPDLASRLTAAPITRLDPPDDALLAAVLAKQFADRQLTPPANLIPYLVSRMERSLAEAARLVADLDAAALSERRNISRTLATSLLDNAVPKGA